MIYVTHDWAEIHGRAQQVVLMDHGSSRMEPRSDADRQRSRPCRSSRGRQFQRIALHL